MGFYPVPANVFYFHPQNSWQGSAEGVLLSYCCLLLFSLALWSEVWILLSGHYSLEYPGSAVLWLFPGMSIICAFPSFPFTKWPPARFYLGPFSICHLTKWEIFPLAHLPGAGDGEVSACLGEVGKVIKGFLCLPGSCDSPGNYKNQLGSREMFLALPSNSFSPWAVHRSIRKRGFFSRWQILRQN